MYNFGVSQKIFIEHFKSFGWFFIGKGRIDGDCIFNFPLFGQDFPLIGEE